MLMLLVIASNNKISTVVAVSRGREFFYRVRPETTDEYVNTWSFLVLWAPIIDTIGSICDLLQAAIR
jgi:hypothetical protein